ncbi:hypothetical protein ACKUVQ_20315 [Mycobacterium seoulense]|uniref:hypothetical protein n=1 Tax=Mycobacterium seoulense TaxID=386911 RepID=UPI003CF0B87E
MTTLNETTTLDEEFAIVDVEATPEGDTDVVEAADAEPGTKRERRPIPWSRILAYGVLPGLALLLALAAGYLKWTAASADDAVRARAESVRAASDDAVALLSYKADSVDKDLAAARERLTGEFKDAYTDLTRQVVIPGAREKRITAVAKVTAAAPVSATSNHAVVLLFVNQTVTIGEGAPTDTQPVVRVTLDKVNGRWLVSHFDPV